MNQEYDMMAHKPIFPLLMKMAIPPMISMLIQSCTILLIVFLLLNWERKH